MAPPRVVLAEMQLISRGFFAQHQDGRWIRDPKQPRCACAEGLAAEAPPETGPGGAYRSCLLCSNWNLRTGCVLGHNQALDGSASRDTALPYAIDQAHAWAELGQLDRAVARLNHYLRGHAGQADAYLALARLYEHPGYHGADKRRAIVLYQRYLELRGPVAAPAAGEDPWVSEAKRRIQALLAAPATPAAEGAREVPPLASFTCFFHFGALMHFVYGRLTREALVLVHVGDADPESGRTSLDLSSSLEQTTRFLRWAAGEERREKEGDLTRREIERVAPLSGTALTAGRSHFTLAISDVEEVQFGEDARRRTLSIRLRSGRKVHELIFPHVHQARFEQCAAVLRALVARAAHAAGAAPPSPTETKTMTAPDGA